jgi:hypothetical protein
MWDSKAHCQETVKLQKFSDQEKKKRNNLVMGTKGRPNTEMYWYIDCWPQNKLHHTSNSVVVG